MQISYSWLKSLTNIDAPVKQLIEDLTLTGTKVESLTSLGSRLEKIVVGKIILKEKHPNADSLFVCKVDIGEKTIQIVTAATNIYEGAIVPVVLDGGTVAAGDEFKKIKKGKLRGEVSEGMMCSIEELGYTTQEYPEAPDYGIYIFPREVPPGSDSREALGLLDDVIEFEITSNRPDCYSVLGIARETAATYNKKFLVPPVSLKEEADCYINSLISVSIENPELCPRYVARVVTDVKIQPSPLWMRRRLIAGGLRPINNIVDITNYVMLEYGQPMHAFDIDNIFDRKIIVRNARADEIFTTLDGVERALDSTMLVISDPDKTVAIAGVMGGENSKVTENASAILFESASFNGTNIRLTCKKLGLRTDASSKYEKGLDPNLALAAVNRAMELIEQLNCGKVVKGLADCYPNRRETQIVNFSPERINALLGTNISSNDMKNYLALLDIMAEQTDGGRDGGRDGVWSAVIPTFRTDIEREADLAEEIARLYGYDKIPVTLESGSPSVGGRTTKQRLIERVKQAMVTEGYCEILTFPFESPKFQTCDAVRIINPLGDDYSVMRTTMLNSVLNSMALNYSRRNSDVRLFETAKVYLSTGKPGELPQERETLALAAYGKTDFYETKGSIERLFNSLGLDAKFEPCSDITHMHPGRAARILLNDIELGCVGELHPNTSEKYEINERVYYAEIGLPPVFETAKLISVFKPLPKFPAISRDIAMKVKEDITVNIIENTIRERAGKYLESVQLFDVYKGSQIESGYKSVAYSLSFRAPDRTLTDNEASDSMRKILANLETKLQAELRK